jgi:hypothetical protein
MFRAAAIAVLSVFAMQTAFAQSVPQQSLGNWSSPYPGAIYVAPQDSAFVAPGIYRSLERATVLANPMEVTQICTRDFRETIALKNLFSGVSEAAGISDVVHKNFGAKLTGLNLKVIKLEGNLEVKDEATFVATPLRVLSADDDIADVILTNIGDGCRKTIRGHMQAGRVVFFASKAIQAKDFTVSLSIGPKGGGGLTCTLPIFCPSVTADVDRQRQSKRSAVQPVTFAIVPAVINGDRRELRQADLNK